MRIPVRYLFSGFLKAIVQGTDTPNLAQSKPRPLVVGVSAVRGPTPF